MKKQSYNDALQSFLKKKLSYMLKSNQDDNI